MLPGPVMGRGPAAVMGRDPGTVVGSPVSRQQEHSCHWQDL